MYILDRDLTWAEDKLGQATSGARGGQGKTSLQVHHLGKKSVFYHTVLGWECTEPPWPWGCAPWLPGSPSQTAATKSNPLAQAVVGREKLSQALSPWFLWATSTLPCQAWWPLFMAHTLGVDLKKKSLTLTRISILSFVRLEIVCLCDPYCLVCHWNSGSSYNRSICFLTLTQQLLVKPFTVQGPVYSGEETCTGPAFKEGRRVCVSQAQEELQYQLQDRVQWSTSS